MEVSARIQRRRRRLCMDIEVGVHDPALNRLLSGLSPAEAGFLMRGILETSDVVSEYGNVVVRRLDFERLAEWIRLN